MMETENQRTLLLMGEESLERLKQACVMVVGIGGVGSYCAEALARCGVGTLILVDGDCISPSNLNRQIHATYETIGQPKTEVMKHHIKKTVWLIVIICFMIKQRMNNYLHI